MKYPMKTELHKLYWFLNAKMWKVFALASPKYATKAWYKHATGNTLNLRKPEKLTEKLQYLKLYYYFKDDLVRKCADKNEVRNYIIEKGCEEILNEQYAVYNDAEDIEWDKLPDQFVLKCNHGCGGNILCYDKKSLDKKEAIRKLNRWMNTEYGLEHVEYSYEGIPRKIIAERLIESEDGFPPRDFKFLCSYGKPIIAYTITGRTESNEYLDYFTPEWKWIDVKNGELENAPNHPPKPVMLDQMLKYASVLSEDFPIVRVDLYCEFENILFGELTFLPTGGVFVLHPNDYDLSFGRLFPDVTKIKRC